VTGIIAVPFDDKSATLLQGRYLSDEEHVQIVRPVGVMSDLLSTILTVQRYVVSAVVMVGAATLATVSLVFMLSLRLRRREIQTMMKIGGSKGRILGVLASEIVAVLVLGSALAGVLTILTSRYGADIIRTVILS